MDPVVIAGIVVGCGLCVVRLVLLQLRWVNHTALNAMLIKLVKADNRDRAIKLANAVPMTPYGRVAKQMLLTSTELTPETGRSLTTEALRESASRELDTQMRLVRKWSWMSPVGVVLAGTAGFIGMSAESAHVATLIVPGGAALLALLAWHRVNVLRRLARSSSEVLIPVLTDAVMGEA